MITNRPDVKLNGECDLLYMMIQFKSITIEHINNKLYYDNRNRCISLNRCAHFKVLTSNVVMIYMNNNTFISLRVPPQWITYFPQWIAYIRQIPMWQIMRLNADSQAMSWALKESPIQNDWNRVFLRFDEDVGVLKYFANEMSDEPLGQLNAQHVFRNEHLLKMGTWSFKFETRQLAKKWENVLLTSSDVLEMPNKGDAGLDDMRGSSKREDQRLIDAVRAKELKKLKRRSLDGWEDDEEEDEEDHLARVMDFLKERN